MKTIKNYCTDNGLKMVKIRYNFQGRKFTGYDIVRPADNAILLSLEPINRPGARWYVRTSHEGYNGQRYASRITANFLKAIDPAARSFFKIKTAAT